MLGLFAEGRKQLLVSCCFLFSVGVEWWGREVKISDLTPPLHFLEQLSHPGRENKLCQAFSRPAINGLVSIYNWKSSALPLFSTARLYCSVPLMPTKSWETCVGWVQTQARSVMTNTDKLGHNQCNHESHSVNMSLRSLADIFGGQK